MTGTARWGMGKRTCAAGTAPLTTNAADSDPGVLMAGRVVVLGSVNMDLTVRTAVLPSPGETVSGSSFEQSHGGKGANQAVAARRAGAEVLLCAAVGADAFGDAALGELRAVGVTTARVARVDEPTGVALIVVDESGENEIVTVAGANRHADGRGVAWRSGDVASAVLEVPMDAVRAFFAEARHGGATTVLNAAPATAGASAVLSLSDVVCVNENELAGLGDRTAGAAVVTSLGRRGVRTVDDRGTVTLAAHPVHVVDTVGAGDALCGVLAAGLAAGLPLAEAVVRANAAAALTVSGRGARSSPTAHQIDALLAGDQ